MKYQIELKIKNVDQPIVNGDSLILEFKKQQIEDLINHSILLRKGEDLTIDYGKEFDLKIKAK